MAAGGATATATGAVAGDEPKFTQKQVNAFLAEERRKTEVHVKTQNKVLLEEKETRISELLANSQLTTAEKERLQADYTKVQEDLKSYRTEKETILRERKASEDALTARAKELEDLRQELGVALQRQHDQARVTGGGRQEQRLERGPVGRALAAQHQDGGRQGRRRTGHGRVHAGGGDRRDEGRQDGQDATLAREGGGVHEKRACAVRQSLQERSSRRHGHQQPTGGLAGDEQRNRSEHLTQAQYEAIRKDPAQSAAVFGRR